MALPDDADLVDEPLAERFPRYLAVFGLTGGLAVVVGTLVGMLSSATLGSSLGWALIVLGVLYLLVGGTRGGGYANIGIGAAGALFGGGRRHDEDAMDHDTRMGRPKKVDPLARLRAGLRPERNPSAFWQVIAGFAFIGAGLYVLSLAG